MSSAAGIRAGAAYIEVSANSSKLKGGMQAAISSIKSGFAVALGAVSAAAVGAGYAISNAMERIDKSGKAADKLGVPIEQFRSLEYAADLAGVSSESLQTALANMMKQGIGADQFGRIADEIAGISDPVLRAQRASDVFGRSWKDVMNLVQGGSGPINAAAADLAAMGGQFSRIDASMVEQANDAMTRLWKSIDAAWDRVAIGLAPVVLYLTELFFDVGQAAFDALGQDGLFQFAATAMQKIADGIHFIRAAYYFAKAAGLQFASTVLGWGSQVHGVVNDLAQAVVNFGRQIVNTADAINAWNPDPFTSQLVQQQIDFAKQTLAMADSGISASVAMANSALSASQSLAEDAQAALDQSFENWAKIGDGAVIAKLNAVRAAMKATAELQAGSKATLPDDADLNKVAASNKAAAVSLSAAMSPEKIGSFMQISLSKVAVQGVNAGTETRQEKLQKETNELLKQNIAAVEDSKLEIG